LTDLFPYLLPDDPRHFVSIELNDRVLDNNLPGHGFWAVGSLGSAQGWYNLISNNSQSDSRIPKLLANALRELDWWYIDRRRRPCRMREEDNIVCDAEQEGLEVEVIYYVYVRSQMSAFRS
jgi:hypothetical protein